MAKSEIKCETPRCIEAIEKWGAHYHGVHEKSDGTQLCERCGAVRKDGVWAKTCASCHKQVDQLFGLFVPHRCKDCDDKLRKQEEARGNHCTRCKSLRMDCFC